MALFHWNPKCVIQGAAVAGTWYYYSEHDDVPEFSIFWAFVLVCIIYFVYDGLDLVFGCEHGTLYTSLFPRTSVSA